MSRHLQSTSPAYRRSARADAVHQQAHAAEVARRAGTFASETTCIAVPDTHATERAATLAKIGARVVLGTRHASTRPGIKHRRSPPVTSESLLSRIERRLFVRTGRQLGSRIHQQISGSNFPERRALCSSDPACQTAGGVKDESAAGTTPKVGTDVRSEYGGRSTLCRTKLRPSRTDTFEQACGRADMHMRPRGNLKRL